MSKRELLAGLALCSIPFIFVGEFEVIAIAAWRLGGWPLAALAVALTVTVSVTSYALCRIGRCPDERTEG